jgi:fatty-acyl-CoA synthase
MDINFDISDKDWIAKWAKYSPMSVAIHDLDQKLELCYSDLNQWIEKLAQYLCTTYDLQKGDRLCVLSMNRWEYVVLFFACQRTGAILVPLNYRLTVAEMSYQLEDANPKVLLFESEFAEIIESLETAVTYKMAINTLFDSAEKAYKSAILSDDIEVVFDQSCMILYTSGTTGNPKGAMITNKMLFWNSINTGLRLNLTQQDTIITFAPFFHTGGWNVLTTPVLHRGGKVLITKKFEPEETLKLCEQYKVSILFGVPTMMQMLADQKIFDAINLKSIRYAIVGGEPMAIPLIKKWIEKGIPIRQGYGLTEFGPNVFSLNEEDALTKIGSVGFANFYIQTKIVDDKAKEVDKEEIGELLLKGPVITPGYWNDSEATASNIVDGEWFCTGDLVKQDTDGYFYIVGRKKDMFISGAENVYPAEIEKVIEAHSAVYEVAVIGAKDEKWGEVGLAYIVLKPDNACTEDDIKAYCKAQLAKYKVPKHIRFIESLPKSDSGKILKKTLKKIP